MAPTRSNRRASSSRAASHTKDSVCSSQASLSAKGRRATAIPCTTSSNKTVVAKEAAFPPLKKQKRRGKSVAMGPEFGQDDSEVEYLATFSYGGMPSDEDDTLEREEALSTLMTGSEFRKLNQLVRIESEDDIDCDMQSDGGDTFDCDVALSSLMKGSDYRKSTQIVRVESEEVKAFKARWQRPTIKDLPKGANDDETWAQVVVPTYFHELLGSDNVWINKEEQFQKLLKVVFDHVYGNGRATPDTKKGSAAYDILYQKTCAFRNSFGSKAIDNTWKYYRANVDREANLTQDEDKVARWARHLLNTKGFLYKGNEKEPPVKSGPLEHPLIVHTLVAHFSVNSTSSAPLLSGLTAKRPYCSLALAAVAVERALVLFSEKLIEKRAAGTSKPFKLIVRRPPFTSSRRNFSKGNWGAFTMEYLSGIKSMKDSRFDRILDEARKLYQYGAKFQPFGASADGMGRPKSFRECVVKDEESDSEIDLDHGTWDDEDCHGDDSML